MKDFEIEKHDLVPKHELLDDKQKEEVMKKFGITLKQFPRILETDPMVKFLNAKIGDVLKITRQSKTAGESEYYRVVIKGA